MFSPCTYLHCLWTLHKSPQTGAGRGCCWTWGTHWAYTRSPTSPADHLSSSSSGLSVAPSVFSPVMKRKVQISRYHQVKNRFYERDSKIIIPILFWVSYNAKRAMVQKWGTFTSTSHVNPSTWWGDRNVNLLTVLTINKINIFALICTAWYNCKHFFYKPHLE